MHCGAELAVQDAELAGRSHVPVRCAKCSRISVIEVATRADSTIVMSPLPSFARAEAVPSSLNLNLQDASLRLPPNKKISLVVTNGPRKGTVHLLGKPRTIVGRDGADIVIEDSEVSRQHCVIEVRGENISLKDLDSTNGTFFDEERARAAVLMDGGEFRIGATILQVRIEPA